MNQIRDNYEKVIKTIVDKNEKIFGNNPKIDKVNVGFTNNIYRINNKYIVKICSNMNNEECFKNEINFYNSNKDYSLIPKLYLANTNKDEIPYMYEILEKVKGVSLYNVWHLLNEIQREKIIKQLCDAMKQFHSNIGENYDWTEKNRKLFLDYYNKAKQLNLFNDEEQNIVNNAYSKFDKYLKSNQFVLIHNDLHFDNIIFNNEKIKLIDFERSIYAPRDFELDILYRMIRKPWKFASEETEAYTKLSDYENIMFYIEKYYPELIHIDNLYKRLGIYDIIYFLKQYIDNLSIIELKQDIIEASKIVISD